jgi:hypothetical protein
MEISRTMGNFALAKNSTQNGAMKKQSYSLNEFTEFEDEFTRQNLKKAYLSVSKNFRKMADNFRGNLKFNT